MNKIGQCRSGRCPAPRNYLNDYMEDMPPSKVNWNKFIWLAAAVITLLLFFLALGSARGQELGHVPKHIAELGIPAHIYNVFPQQPFHPVLVEIHKPPHDADTFRDVTLHIPALKLALPHEVIKAYGYDAWEVNKVRRSASAGEITNNEIMKGLLAKDAFNKLLLLPSRQFYAQDRLYIDPLGRDMYGRITGWFYLDLDEGPGYAWLNVAAYMFTHGHNRVRMDGTPSVMILESNPPQLKIFSEDFEDR